MPLDKGGLSDASVSNEDKLEFGDFLGLFGGISEVVGVSTRDRSRHMLDIAVYGMIFSSMLLPKSPVVDGLFISQTKTTHTRTTTLLRAHHFNLNAFTQTKRSTSNSSPFECLWLVWWELIFCPIFWASPINEADFGR
jgi:hypothetical protein